MITANPDLKAIFGTNEGSAEGAVQGVKEAGKGGGKVLVGGYDSGKAQIDAINAATRWAPSPRTRSASALSA